MAEKTKPAKITLSCWVLAHVLALGATGAGAILESFFVYELVELRNQPWQGWAGVAGGSIVIPGMVVAAAYYYLFHLAIRLDFGERFRIHTILRTREVDWKEVGRFELLDTDSIRQRIKSVMPIHIMLTDGSQFAIWTSIGEAERALRFVRSKRWAQDWKGAPWGRTLPVLAILLGSFIATAGIVVAMVMNQNQLLFLLGGIIVGVVAIGYGTYHLVRRPIYYRPAAGYASENRLIGIIR